MHQLLDLPHTESQCINCQKYLELSLRGQPLARCFDAALEIPSAGCRQQTCVVSNVQHIMKVVKDEEVQT